MSNFIYEPMMVALLSIAVFFAWFLAARRGLKPFVGVILLVILSAGALALRRFVPALRE